MAGEAVEPCALVDSLAQIAADPALCTSLTPRLGKRTATDIAHERSAIEEVDGSDGEQSPKAVE